MHLALDVLSSANKEFDRCGSTTKVKRDFNGDSVSGTLPSFIKEVCDEALSSKKVESKVNVVAVLSARGEVVKLRV